jgi:DNA invertase Pin-like site-specific DNA recombinase
MGVIAEFERGRIGERVRDSLQYRIAQGHWQPIICSARGSGGWILRRGVST